MIFSAHEIPTDFAPNNFLNSIFHIVKAVLFSPRPFFENMKTEGGLRNPFLFLACCVMVHTLVVSFFVGNQAIIVLKVLHGILIPVVTAWIMFFIITRIFKVQGTYEVAFRVTAYASAIVLFSWIPFVGLFLQLYQFYLIVVGLCHTFSIKVSQALLAVIAALVIYIVCMGPLTAHILSFRIPAVVS